MSMRSVSTKSRSRSRRSRIMSSRRRMEGEIGEDSGM